MRELKACQHSINENNFTELGPLSVALIFDVMSKILTLQIPVSRHHPKPLNGMTRQQISSLRCAGVPLVFVWVFFFPVGDRKTVMLAKDKTILYNPTTPTKSCIRLFS